MTTLFSGLDDEVERVDDVVGVELLAVVELDALAQLELERLVVDPQSNKYIGMLLF